MRIIPFEMLPQYCSLDICILAIQLFYYRSCHVKGKKLRRVFHRWNLTDRRVPSNCFSVNIQYVFLHSPSNDTPLGTYGGALQYMLGDSSMTYVRAVCEDSFSHSLINK